MERKEYKTDEYRTIVSGYKPNLDFMETYNKVQTITITPKAKRWGLGLQAGYGYPGGFYIGGGASQHITVVTSERVRWIEIVRNDMTTLIFSVLMYQENSCKIIMDESDETMNIRYEAFSPDEIEAQYKVSEIVESELKSLLSRSEIVRKSILLKLKLNPKEDSGIINILDDIIAIFSNIGNDLSNSVGNVRCDFLAF